jgi:hypothetical protein
MSRTQLLQSPPVVINVGLEGFARDLARQGVATVQVDWTPPARGDAALGALVSRLETAHGERIAAANATALDRMLRADPVLVDVRPAGPPVQWARMCGPMRGAIAGVAVFEGWAGDLAEATRMAEAGAFEFVPNHHLDAVGPMTGMTTTHMPVMVVENRAFGNRAYCALNEGLGKVMRFGGNDAEVIARLHWLADVLAPLLAAALQRAEGVPLKGIVARGLAMGDEMHQRNVACTSLLVRALAPSIVRSCADSEAAATALEFMGGNDQLFLNVAMVMGKAMMDPVREIEASTVVTAMSRNGTEFGIRVSGTGDEWFVAPVEMPRGLYFPGFTEADANPDMGDSTIVETIGLGGFAMAASPAVAGFVGAGSASEALGYTRSMYEITTGTNGEWTIPGLDFAGVPTGIDVLKVVASGTVPTINTGIAHREPGIGQVGAGVVNAPYECFRLALEAIAERLDAR